MILPLNAELNTESTGGKFAKGTRDDPKGDESGNEEDEDAGERVRFRSNSLVQRYIHDGKTTTDVLTGETGDSATSG